MHGMSRYLKSPGAANARISLPFSCRGSGGDEESGVRVEREDGEVLVTKRGRGSCCLHPSTR